MPGPKARKEISNRMEMNGAGQNVCLRHERLKECVKLLFTKTLKEPVTSPGAIHKTNRKYGKQSV